MKVLQVIDSGGLYGAEQVLVNLIRGLSHLSVECTLASIAEPEEPEKDLEAVVNGLGMPVMRTTMSVGPDRRAALDLVTSAKMQGFDVLHTHGYKANSLVAGLPRRKRGLPALATLHGWTATSRFSRLGAYEAVERLALRRADCVVAVSEAMVRKWQLDRRYGAKLTVIPNGIEVRLDGREKVELPDQVRSFVAGRPSIVAVGRFSPEKGFDRLIRAFSRLRDDGRDVCLVLAGEGPERQRLEGLVRERGLENSVIMPGYLEHAGELIHYFDVLAIPSRTEGLPIVLLEALHAGMPVAAFAVGDIPAVLTACGAGTCVQGEADEDMARKLHDLIGKEASARERQLVSGRAAARYSAESMARSYLRLYAEMIGSQ